MTITVTAEDIALGVPLDPGHCPIARALQRQTGQPWQVDGCDAIQPNGVRLLLPAEACRFAARWDYAHLRSLCQPFTFDLGPEVARKRGTRH